MATILLTMKSAKLSLQSINLSCCPVRSTEKNLFMSLDNILFDKHALTSIRWIKYQFQSTQKKTYKTVIEKKIRNSKRKQEILGANLKFTQKTKLSTSTQKYYG